MDLAVILLVEVVCVFAAWRTAARLSCGATGPLFITAAFLFHGAIELARLVLPPPRDDTFLAGYGDLRRSVSEESLRTWRLWAMFAIFIFTVVYLVTALWRRAAPVGVPRPQRLTFFPWFVTAPLALLLWPALLRSGQANISTPDKVQNDYWAGGLANQFLLLLVALAVVDFALRRNMRWLPSLAALAVACISMLVIGQRLEVAAVATMSLGALWWYGAKPSRRMMLTTAALLVVCTITLTLARSQVGRQEFIQGGATSRVQNLASATNGIVDKDSALYAASNMANRFDGNGFPALVLEAQEHTEWRSGVGPFVVGANLTVPSFLNPGKTDSDVTNRSEKEYVKAGYGMLFDFDFLPTQFGSALAMGGPSSLLGFGAVAGLAFALFDRFLRRRTEARLILGLVVSESIIANYESDLSSWPVALRSALVFLAVIAIGTIVRRVLGRSAPASADIAPPAHDDASMSIDGRDRSPFAPAGQRVDGPRRTELSPEPLGFDLFAGDQWDVDEPVARRSSTATLERDDSSYS